MGRHLILIDCYSKYGEHDHFTKSSLQIPISCFTEKKKNYPKFYMESQKTLHNQNNPKQKEQWGITILDLQMCYKHMAIKILWISNRYQNHDSVAVIAGTITLHLFSIIFYLLYFLFILFTLLSKSNLIKYFLHSYQIWITPKSINICFMFLLSHFFLLMFSCSWPSLTYLFTTKILLVKLLSIYYARLCHDLPINKEHKLSLII